MNYRIADMHNDILTCGCDEAEIKAYLDGASETCDIITMAVWTTESAPEYVDGHYLSYLREAFQKYEDYRKQGRVAFAIAFAIVMGIAVYNTFFRRGKNG